MELSSTEGMRAMLQAGAAHDKLPKVLRRAWVCIAVEGQGCWRLVMRRKCSNMDLLLRSMHLLPHRRCAMQQRLLPRRTRSSGPC